jgi:hypothetical protein
MYRLQGLVHDTLVRAVRHLNAAIRARASPGTLGQGTVEYVALILLVALIMAGVVAAMKGFRTDEGQQLGDVILSRIKQAVRRVQF